MPIVTGTPVIINVTHSSEDFYQEILPLGQLEANDATYLVLQDFSSSDPPAAYPASIRVYKTTDDGTTWTEQDAAHNITVARLMPQAIAFDGTKIYICYFLNDAVSANKSLHVDTFDTSTDLYDTPGTPLVGSVARNVGGLASPCYVLSDGTFVVFVGGPPLGYLTYLAGTWSAFINWGTLTGNQAAGVVRDSADRAHISYGSQSPSNTLQYGMVDGSLSAGSPTQLGTSHAWDGLRASHLIWDTSNIAIAWTESGTFVVKVAIGTPLSAAAFTTHTVDTASGTDIISYAWLTEDTAQSTMDFIATEAQALNASTCFGMVLQNPSPAATGKLTVRYIVNSLANNPYTKMEIWESKFDGVSAWSTPVLYYDFIANPPPGGITDPTQFIENGQALFGAAAPPPTSQTLTLQKMVQGGPAAPSDFTLSATGGSPETTISGPGPTVGPEDVNAGTFELSETAPGGATWDSATSTWDGPSIFWDGAGQYTPVWDCNGAPMPTPTSVVVSPGGGGPIPLGVTQVPDIDPTFQPLLSNGPFEFLIGGFFYQVLWNSGNRLGMFRRQASVGGMFSEVDQGNAPTGISGYGRATSRGTKISVCYMLPGNTTAQMVEFDTVAGAWGTPSAVVTLPAVTNLFAWVRRSDNTDVFFGAWASHWYYITNIAGVWGAVTNLTNVTGTVIGGVIDSTDQSWIMINYPFGGNPAAVGLFPVSSTYVLGSAIANRQLIFQGPPYPYRFYPDVALYGTTAIAFAYSTAVNPTDLAAVRVSIIRPISAPALTDFLAYISTAGQESYLLKLKDDGSGVLNMFFVNTEGARYQVFQTHWDDPFNWTAPTVFYDPSVTPPDHGSASQQISSLDPVPSNGWAVGAGMQTDQPTEITTAEIIQESSGGGTSDVVCTVTNFFMGPPPTPPGPGQMNPVGCFELLRVDATLMPARHLPTRGSVR